jgi:dephospho-CoA kinase
VIDSSDDPKAGAGRAGRGGTGEPRRPPNRPFLIGLTGPIGCGKSTVARWLADRGGTVIDADALAREATADGEPTIDPIRLRFGSGVFRADGSLDRAALARIVFSDEGALRDLERIVHPAVRRRVLDRLETARVAGDPFVVLEAIKLVEGGLAEQCDEVWLVDCSDDTQRARLGSRGMAPDEIGRRTSAQGDLVARLGPRTTRTLRTDGSPAETEQLVEETLADALAPVLLD